MRACVAWLIDTPECQHYNYPGHNHTTIPWSSPCLVFHRCWVVDILFSVSLVPADRVTGGRCLLSLLPLNGRGGLNQLSVNRFCWEVNRVEGDWSRVVHSPLSAAATHSSLSSISSISPSLVSSSTCPAFFITHRIMPSLVFPIFHIFSDHFLVVDSIERARGRQSDQWAEMESVSM